MALTVIVVTPEETVLSEETDFVSLTLFDGEIGIAPRHTPFIGRLGYGEMRVNLAGKTARYYVDGGFVQCADDVVTLLTNRAIPAAEIDSSAAQKQLEAALQRPINTPELLEIRDRQIAQARAQLNVAQRSSLA